MNSIVSIVGRPNVGKSTLFNRMVGSRDAIVHDEFGVTRDRHYGETFWNGLNFTVIDTGGYLPDEMDVIYQGVREQANIAMEESDLILFVVDTADGVNPLDESVAQILREQEKPVLLVVNKADNEHRMMSSAEFYSLGFDELYPVSAISGTGTGELMDKIVDLLPGQDRAEEVERQEPKIAFVGRPNVGKSSMVNALVKSERCIVTEIPGTTRDAIDSEIQYEDETYILVDTAGLRKKAKVRGNIEFYSNVRTDRALRECDVAIVIVDAMQGFEEQDKRIIREAARLNKGIIIVLNKWDTVPEKETNLFKEFQEYVYERIPMMRYIPIISTSALTGQRVDRILETARQVILERKKKISTPDLNDYLAKFIQERPLPMKRGKKLKIQYATQVKSSPPVFKFFMNNPEELPPNYRRFIEKKLRDQYQFTGVPITMVFRQK
ncbi:MAG: ribosome biogenesis GTPase Der [Balneolaceae bacterium]